MRSSTFTPPPLVQRSPLETRMPQPPPSSDEGSMTNLAHKHKAALADALRDRGIFATPYILAGRVTLRLDEGDVTRLVDLLQADQ